MSAPIIWFGQNAKLICSGTLFKRDGVTEFATLPISLSSGITGVLPVANGGTNNSSVYSSGSVLFSDGSSITQNNAEFFWDNTNHRLGLGTTGPQARLELVRSFNMTTGNPNQPNEFPGSTLFSVGETFQYQLYGYKVVGGVQYFTTTGATTGTLTISNDGDYVFLDWEAGTDIDGYRLLRNRNDAGFIEYYDVASTSFSDDESFSWNSGSTVTPTNPELSTKLDYSDGSNYWGLHTAERGYFGDRVGINQATPLAFLHVKETANQSALIVEGTGDGGSATYGPIETRSANSGYKLMLFSTDGSGGNYGCFYVFGDRNLGGGRLGEVAFCDRSVGGDERRAGFFTDYASSQYQFGMYVASNYKIIAAETGVWVGSSGPLPSVPSARLHIMAGSATAGTAPIKIDSGTLLTTPEAGTIEYDGTNFYLTV